MVKSEIKFRERGRQMGDERRRGGGQTENVQQVIVYHLTPNHESSTRAKFITDIGELLDIRDSFANSNDPGRLFNLDNNSLLIDLLFLFFSEKCKFHEMSYSPDAKTRKDPSIDQTLVSKYIKSDQIAEDQS